MRDRFSFGFRLMGLLVIPTSVVFLVLTQTIDTSVLAFGEFSADKAALTAETLAAFALGMFAFSAYLYSLRAFYAMQNTKTPFLLNCFENGTNVVIALALFPALGVRGLALAWSIAYAIAAVATLVVLRRRLGPLDGRRITATVSRIVLASAVLAAVVWLLVTVLGTSTRGRAVVAVAVAVVVGGLAYLGSLFALRVDEVRGLRGLLRR